MVINSLDIILDVLDLVTLNNQDKYIYLGGDYIIKVDKKYKTLSLKDFTWRGEHRRDSNLSILKIEHLVPTTKQKLPSLLTDQEKEYLHHFIQPFREIVIGVVKIGDEDEEYLKICCLNDTDSIYLPRFKSGTMYTNLERYARYYLDDLEI